MKVLVVDDDRFNRELVRRAVAKAGHEVLEASHGAEALAMIARHDCRVVISDWEMPEMDGIELVRRIRSGESDGYVYTILVTARDNSQDVIDGLAAGADDFLRKPLNPAELTVRLLTAERVLTLETRDLTIMALAKLAESRDPETGAHLERVQNYCRVLASSLSLDPRYRSTVTPEFVRLVYQTSPLHDIGKVGIPDAVLLKPGRLSDREFQIMKMHTTIGAETLEAVLKQAPGAKFLAMARDIAACHHERFDGLGYPNGLKGADIPLSARIVSVSDVYDALTSRRVYKAAMTHEVARGIIVEGSGSHFDPDVVEAFLRVEDKFVAIRDRFSEPEHTAAAA